MRRFFSLLAVAIGLAPAGAALAAPQATSVEKAPRAWVEYAGLVVREATARLSGDDPTALRLRDYMLQTSPAAGEASPPLSLRLWIDSAGVITRVEFAPFVDQQPNDDLRALLIGQKLSAPPPKNMLQPLRIAVQVAPAPDKGEPAGQPS